MPEMKYYGDEKVTLRHVFIIAGFFALFFLSVKILVEWSGDKQNSHINEVLMRLKSENSGLNISEPESRYVDYQRAGATTGTKITINGIKTEIYLFKDYEELDRNWKMLRDKFDAPDKIVRKKYNVLFVFNTTDSGFAQRVLYAIEPWEGGNRRKQGALLP